MILLTCDHPKRELKDLIKLQKILRINNIKSKIINKNLITKAYNLYKPKIITVPHSVSLMYKTINQIHKKTKIALLPSESCIFVNKFIDMLYCNKFQNHKEKSNHKKIDYFFTQSKFTSNYLNKNNLIKKNLIDTGFLYYDYWYDKKKFANNKKKTIGIALSVNLPFRYYNNKNFLNSYHQVSENLNFFNNYWRLNELSLNLFYLSLMFEIIEELSKKYIVNIRSHPLDTHTSWKRIFDNKNIVFDNHSSLSDWLSKQDVVISTFSAINIDSYIFKKPHISLINMIPKKFLNFKAYNSHRYTDYKEFFSVKPKSINDLSKIIKKIKFKKNNSLEKKLKKYYNFPQKKKTVEIIAKNLIKIHKNQNKIFKPIIYSKIQKNLNYFLGNTITSFIFFYFGEMKTFFNVYNNSNYFSLFTRFFMRIPYNIYRFFN